MICEEDEEDSGTLQEILNSFQLSGPNEELSKNDQQNEELASSEDLVVHSLSPCMCTEEMVQTQGDREKEDFGIGHKQGRIILELI